MANRFCWHGDVWRASCPVFASRYDAAMARCGLHGIVLVVARSESTGAMTARYVVLCTGGRAYADRDHVFAVLDALHAERAITLIVHGACGLDEKTMRQVGYRERMTGADRWADDWSLERGIPCNTHVARWLEFGPSAGPRRNRAMLKEDMPDVVIAFPGDRGTADCIRQARALGIEVRACCGEHPLSTEQAKGKR